MRLTIYVYLLFVTGILLTSCEEDLTIYERDQLNGLWYEEGYCSMTFYMNIENSTFVIRYYDNTEEISGYLIVTTDTIRLNIINWTRTNADGETYTYTYETGENDIPIPYYFDEDVLVVSAYDENFNVAEIRFYRDCFQL